MNARPIDHEEAVKNLMAERYLLGELNTSEREAYEEHLFDCSACFEQVKAGTEFVGHLRRIGTEEPVTTVSQPLRRLRHNMLRPAAAFAFAACILAGTSLYQNMITIQMLKAPQVESRYMLTEQARGKLVVNAPRHSRIRLAIEFRRPKEFASYEAEIQTPDGKIRYAVPFLLPPSQDVIELSLYAGTLQPGKYILVVQGRDGDSKQELARDPFTMELRD